MNSNLSEDVCPICKVQFLTKPRVSEGYHTPENAGRMYQKCPDNTHDDSRSCSGFVWRDDIEAPKKVGKHETCTGPSCSSRARARTLHQKCIRHFCITCCKEAAKNPTASKCLAPKHKLVNITPASASIPAASSNSQTRPAQPYGKMLSPIYRKKLEEIDADIESSVFRTSQKDRYRKENETMIEVKWWNEDGKPPLQFSAPVPDYPYFHPKDCSIISDVIGMSNCKLYSVFDPVTATWTFTSLSRKVKSGTTLYLRSRDITTCLGLDLPTALGSPSKKRALSITDSGPLNHSKKRPSTAVVDVDHDERAVSVPPPSSSPPPQSDDDANDTSDTISVNIDLSTAPRGSRAPFPLIYACDMGEGFRQLRTLKETGATTQAAYLSVFGGAWKASTFSDHNYVWANTPAVIMSAAMNTGRAPGGEWANLLAQFGRKKALQYNN